MKKAQGCPGSRQQPARSNNAMRLTEDRISHVSHLVLDMLMQDRNVDAIQPEERILREIKRTISDELKFEDEADAAARRTIQSLSRRVPEGSREWDVLYRKYFEEELNRRRKI
ncbi:MAG TPA: DUF507 family protein [Nitrospirota bacterium]|nr:DUF507 family protein [Nitrospirota bacterium]